MTEKTSYLPGEPLWFDLSTPDIAASTAFYGALLGWEAEEGSAEHGGYTNLRLRDRRVVGFVPHMSPEQATTWTVYVCTDDSDKTAARVAEAGGSTMVPPMAVGSLGTMAVFVDPAGGVFGTWQPGDHAGSGLVREAGAPVWSELSTDAPVTSFYSSVFDWEVRTSPAYVELLAGGEGVAGVTDTAQGTSGWLPYFGADDPAAAAEQAVALGGSVVLPLTEFPGGSCTIVRDPHGAVLGLITT